MSRSILIIVCAILLSIHAVDHKFELKFAPSEMNLLVDQLKNVSLDFQPNHVSESFSLRFGCQNPDDSSEFPFDSNKFNCTLLYFPNGDIIHFNNSINGTINFQFKTKLPGKTQLVATTNSNSILSKNAYITINIGKSQIIITLSAIIGWIYFIVWSVSFYPQIYENFRLQSCEGLSIDYAMLNIMGFFSYTLFNVSLYFIDSVQRQYEIKKPRSQIPVELNDVVFAVHALLCCTIILYQYYCYGKGQQKLSYFACTFLAVCFVAYPVLLIIVIFTEWMTFLTFIYIASYIKLSVTLVKYIPQAYYNYQRKSTKGWSIVNIFLDTTGGLLSMIQMFMLGYNYDDWATIFNNFTKFGLGLTSILFDIFFLVQHYILYGDSDKSSSNSDLVNAAEHATNQDAKRRMDP